MAVFELGPMSDELELKSDTHQLLRKHRFRVSIGDEEADNALLMVSSLSLKNNKLYLGYYACTEMLKFITERSGLDHLLVALTSGDGTPLIDVVVNDLKIIESGVSSLDVNCCSTDIIKLTAVYSFESTVTSVTNHQQ